MNAEHSLANPVAPALIIHDAGIPGFIACWLEARRCDALPPHADTDSTGGWADLAPIAWLPDVIVPDSTDPHGLASLRRRTVAHHVSLCPLAGLSEDSPLIVTASQAADAPYNARGLHDSLMLLAALAEATRLGRRRVVWPVAPGVERNAPPISAIADACDRAMLTAQLFAIDYHAPVGPARGGTGKSGGGGSGGVEIETPFVDLTDDEIIELGVDAGVPFNTAWWCESPKPAIDGQSTPTQCGNCPACKRWLTAISRVCGRAALTEPKHPPITITSAAQDLLDREKRK